MDSYILNTSRSTNRGLQWIPRNLTPRLACLSIRQIKFPTRFNSFFQIALVLLPPATGITSSRYTRLLLTAIESTLRFQRILRTRRIQKGGTDWNPLRPSYRVGYYGHPYHVHLVRQPRIHARPLDAGASDWIPHFNQIRSVAPCGREHSIKYRGCADLCLVRGDYPSHCSGGWSHGPFTSPTHFSQSRNALLVSC
jgi:hypothetical protein